MMLAPTPPITVTLTRAPGGRAGVFHTLANMRRLVNESHSDPAVLQCATSLIYLTPEKDQFSEVQAIFDWVRDTVRYVQDPLGLESVAAPRLTILRKVGDCDDQTTLLCALFEVVGYPTRFVMAAYSDPNVYEHVYSQVFAAGNWIDCDPTERAPLGYAPPGALKLYFEG